MVLGDERVAEAAPQLGKGLKSRHVAMISIGGIIGAGLFVGSSSAIAAVGPAIILSYIMAGILILCVMRMLGEMAASNPHITSFTEFSRAGLGDWAGFTAGWLYWFFWVVVVAVEAIAGAVILREWLPFEVWQIGLGLMLVMTAVNLMSTRSYGEFEFWFASLKVAAILAFIVVAAASLFGLTPVQPAAEGLSNLWINSGFAPAGAAAVLSGVVTVVFALTGAEIATIAAAESSEPAKMVARMTTSVALRIVLFYVLSILLILAVVPWNTVVPGVSPFASALEGVGIPGAALAMKLIVLVAVLSCLNSGVYVTSRVLFILAANGDAPRALVALNKRKVPARAIVIGSVFGYGAVVASVVSPQMVFAFLLNASGATMLIVYLMTAFAHIRLRKAMERTAPERLLVKMWLFPGLSYVIIVAMFGVLAAMTATPSLLIQLVMSLMTLGAALAAYWLFRARRRPAIA